MVRVRVRVRVATKGVGPSVFERNVQCLKVSGVNTRDECHLLTSEQAWEAMASSSVKPVGKRAPYR
jgi:hypothetical protein